MDRTYKGFAPTPVKVGTVFAGKKSPNVHNEIIRFFAEGGKKFVEIEQYSKTSNAKKVILTEREVNYVFAKEMVYVILQR